MKKSTAILFVALALAGCAGLNAQGALMLTYNTPPAVGTVTLAPGGVASPLAALAAAAIAPAAAAAASAPAAAASASK